MEDSLKSEKVDSSAVREISRILGISDLNGPEATAAMMPLLYEELHRLAAYRLSLEKPGQTLQTTALVNEVYLRLIQDSEAHWENKRHFFAAAAEAMRRILIENARHKKTKKCGGDWCRTAVDVASVCVKDPPDEVLQVHEVLDEFAEVDPDSAELVKLRFFVGLTLQQCADILGISKRTVESRWAFARAWLYRAICENNSKGNPPRRPPFSD